MGNPAGREWLQTRWRSPRNAFPRRRIGYREKESERGGQCRSRRVEEGGRKGYTGERGRKREEDAWTGTHTQAGTHVSRPRGVPPPPLPPPPPPRWLFVHESSVYLVPFRDRVGPSGCLPFFSSIFAPASFGAREPASGIASTLENRPFRPWK